MLLQYVKFYIEILENRAVFIVIEFCLSSFPDIQYD